MQCNVCGHEGPAKKAGVKHELFSQRKILDGGFRYGKCSKCKCKERERMLAYYLSNEISPGDASLLLTIAPNRHLWPWFRSNYPKLREICLDMDPKRYAFANNIVQGDITKLPFLDDMFDLIICSHVMEHIPNDMDAFSELRRVCKPTGKAILLVPLVADGRGPIEIEGELTRAQRLKNYGQGDHVRVYDIETFKARAEAAGMTCDLFDPFSVDPVAAERFGFLEGSVIFVCSPAEVAAPI